MKMPQMGDFSVFLYPLPLHRSNSFRFTQFVVDSSTLTRAGEQNAMPAHKNELQDENIL
jgi:hypothetical protein